MHDLRTQRSRPPVAARRAALAAGALLALAVLGTGAVAGVATDPAPVALHPAVGDTLDAREATRCGLFADEPGFQQAIFVPAPWGGYAARITVATSAGTVIRERNVPTAQLLAWRALIGAVWSGATPPPPAAAVAVAPTDTVVATAAIADTAAVGVAPTEATATPAVSPRPGRVRVWPEVPLPSGASRSPGLMAPRLRPPAPPAVPARWLVAAGLGYRRCTTDFDRFFTNMGLVEVAFSHRLGRALVPYWSFQYGFGDIPDAFEAVSQNGRSALYALEAGLIVRTPLARRTHAYAGLGWGYYMRSLRWGGEPFLGSDGYLYSGTLVREMQTWGAAARVGVQFGLSPSGKGRKERLLDVQLRLEEYARASFEPFETGSEYHDVFRAEGRDRWLALSVSLITGL